ncbi:MAG: helix-turn-helix domain-containing protein [Chloroflexi bacterium]|nr:helix-turn-helix domain-containing protein [Chloroflexota bacterium]MBI2980671.1 helix-turn-helix domain-containing protein [Chloroflexota bacterium]
MARKATVDKDVVLRMLREGESTYAVAKHFGVSRQAVDLHRKEFIQGGLLVDKRAPRKTLNSPMGDITEVKNYPAISLDRLVDLVIEAFNSLKKVPALEAELEKYRRSYQKANERIELLEKEVSKRKEQEDHWRLTLQQWKNINNPSNDR